MPVGFVKRCTCLTGKDDNKCDRMLKKIPCLMRESTDERPVTGHCLICESCDGYPSWPRAK